MFQKCFNNASNMLANMLHKCYRNAAKMLRAHKYAFHMLGIVCWLKLLFCLKYPTRPPALLCVLSFVGSIFLLVVFPPPALVRVVVRCSISVGLCANTNNSVFMVIQQAARALKNLRGRIIFGAFCEQFCKQH